MRRFSLSCLLLFSSAFAFSLQAVDPNFETMEFPQPPASNGVQAPVLVIVTFGADGAISDLKILGNENQPAIRDFIQTRWHSRFLAGFSNFVWLEPGADHPAAMSIWPRPPYPKEARESGEQGTVSLVVTFDDAGRVSRCAIENTTAPKDLSEFARKWVLAKWRTKRARGQTIHRPFRFLLTPAVNMHPA